MVRTTCCLLACLLIPSTTTAAPGPEVIDPELAKADPDFLVQGEFLGEGRLPDGSKSDGPKSTIGAQVIALGEAKFRVVVYRGGLPGDGWQRGDERLFLDGEREDDVTKLTAEKLAGKIRGDTLSVTKADGRRLFQLKRTVRKSPNLGQPGCCGAIALFDGNNTERFKDGKMTPMKTLEAGTTTIEQFPMARLHLEFRLSWKPGARGQGRSNSGIYITGLPEIQVLDSFGLEGAKNECGAFYGRREPDVNMCFGPLVWQTFDVEFTPTRFDREGRPIEQIRVTVRHNGVVIHEAYDTRSKEAPPRSIHLQRHGNRVQYRNIWAIE